MNRTCYFFWISLPRVSIHRIVPRVGACEETDERGGATPDLLSTHYLERRDALSVAWLSSITRIRRISHRAKRGSIRCARPALLNAHVQCGICGLRLDRQFALRFSKKPLNPVIAAGIVLGVCTAHAVVSHRTKRLLLLTALFFGLRIDPVEPHCRIIDDPLFFIGITMAPSHRLSAAGEGRRHACLP